MAQSSTPLFISGHVTVNGNVTGGVSVSAGGLQTTTDSSGYFQLVPGVANGSSVSVTATTVDGHSQSSTVTQHGQGMVQVDLTIDYSTETVTPTQQGSAPAANNDWYYQPSITPAPTSTPSPTPTPSPSPSPSPTPSPTPTAAPSPTPAPTGGIFLPWWLIALAAVALVAVGGYYWYSRK